MHARDWHQPTFSSTAADWKNDSAEGTLADAWWKLLYANHADVILNGHDHVYSRFAPMEPNGTADPRHGIREFIIGTGGESLDTLNPTPPPNLQAATDQYYGVMKLTLHNDGYAWDYASAPGAPSPGTGTYSDTAVPAATVAGTDRARRGTGPRMRGPAGGACAAGGGAHAPRPSVSPVLLRSVHFGTARMCTRDWRRILWPCVVVS